MEEFTFEELKNIVYKHNITHIPYDESQKNELWDIVNSYKINTPCIYEIKSTDSWCSWMNTTIPFQMTVRDLKSMKHYDALEILFLNKEFMNFENLSLEANDNRNTNLVLESKDFFLNKKYNTTKSYIYIHDEGYNGILNFGKEWKRFDWQFEIYPGEFRSLEDMRKEFGEEFVSSFNPDPNMRIGWTAPAIPVKNLSLCPDIIF